MARKIIKPGLKKFRAICPKCGCEFEYELEDISVLWSVTCPECHNSMLHPDQVAYIQELNLGGNKISPILEKNNYE